MTVDTDDPGEGGDTRTDVPLTFDPRHRGFTTRRVRHTWARDITTGITGDAIDASPDHDPFALLGW